jgi:hypothetical protein
MRFAPFMFAVGLGGCQLLTGDFEVAPAESGAPCHPGEVRCEGSKLLGCGGDLRFVTLEDCSSAATCDPSARACRPCTPGERACNGAELLVCESSGWRSERECATPELCVFPGDRSTGQCAPPICEWGEYRCDGSVLFRCARARDHWELLELCADEYHCVVPEADAMASAGEGAHCQPSCTDDCVNECEPGTKRCEGFLLEHCNGDGVWVDFEACSTPALCNAVDGYCIAPACQEQDETRCSGQNFERCAADLTHFELQQQCTEDQACGPSGCSPRVACSEPSFNCRTGTLERCEAGEWKPYLVCDSPALCNATDGVCDPRECFPGTYACEGNQIYKCDRAGYNWVYSGEFCPPGTMCTPYFDTSDIANACVPL